MIIDELLLDGRRCSAMLAAGVRCFLEMRSDSVLWAGKLRAPQVASLGTLMLALRGVVRALLRGGREVGTR